MVRYYVDLVFRSNAKSVDTNVGGGSSGKSGGSDSKKKTNDKKMTDGIVAAGKQLGVVAALLSVVRNILQPILETAEYGVFVLLLLMSKLLEGIVKGLAALFSGDFWKGVWDWLVEQAGTIWDTIKGIFESGLAIITGIGQSIWDSIMIPLETLNNVGILIWEQIIKPAFEFLINIGQWLWDQIIQPAFQTLSNVGLWILEQIIKPAFNFLASVGIWIWDQILKPAFSFLSDVGQWIWEQILKPGLNFLANIGELIWTQMKSAFKWTIDLGAKIWEWVKSKLGGMFGGSDSGSASGSKAFGGIIPVDGLYKMHAGETVSRGNTTSIDKSVSPTINIVLGGGSNNMSELATQVSQKMMSELTRVQRF